AGPRTHQGRTVGPCQRGAAPGAPAGRHRPAGEPSGAHPGAAVSSSGKNRRPCPEGFAGARLAKATAFMDAAELTSTFDDTQELRDASVTLWIHSGIASTDFICCKRLGE